MLIYGYSQLSSNNKFKSYPYNLTYNIVHKYRGDNLHTLKKKQLTELINNEYITNRDLILTLLNIDGRLLWRFDKNIYYLKWLLLHLNKLSIDLNIMISILSNNGLIIWKD